MDYYLAIDIGASSGRHILGHLENGKLIIEEIHRFDNGIKEDGDNLVWNTESLFNEICNGLIKCKQANKQPKTMGIDTWGVDYVLLDANKQRIGKSYAYRDNRTEGMDKKLDMIMSLEEVYQRTGLQKLPFNTIYQLMAHKVKHPEDLQKAAYFLMMPDYFHFLLTGEISNEYTNASTTQLVDVRNKQWDKELIRRIGIDTSIFSPISKPKTKLGRLSENIVKKVGFCCDVVLPCTHDTGSAFMAVPAANDNSVYLSSGTWSLMGCELQEPITTPLSKQLNYTNEGGYNYRYRYLKNIMGLWMLQSVKGELKEKLSYQDLYIAASETEVSTIIDCDDNRFLAPKSMIKEIQNCCAEQGFKVYKTPGELAAVIYNSLADCYKRTVKELSELTKKDFESLHIVGGGSQDVYLNRLTAKALKVPVFAGPIEATALGNLMAQMIADKVFVDLKQARRCIFESFGTNLVVTDN